MGGRSVADLVVLAITATVCAAVLATIIAVAIIEVVDPETDTTATVGRLSDVINTLIGLMAGFVAGRTNRVQEQRGPADL
jgi:K+-sensing histidine kinase KdpD